MPEGDTILRAARGLAPLLTGKTVLRFESPLAELARAELVGHVVTGVEARGKNLLLRFDDGRVLHTHMRMNGSWHVYKPGERWKRGAWRARAVLEVEGVVAVCFDAPVVRLVRSDRSDPRLLSVGPDILADDFDAGEARRRLKRDGARPIGEAIVDQRCVAGVGNIYKSESLFAAKIDPRSPVAALDDANLDAVVSAARKLMRASMKEGRVRFHVYERGGRPCTRCGQAVVRIVQGRELPRSTYFCPGCQRTKLDGSTNRAPSASAPASDASASDTHEASSAGSADTSNVTEAPYTGGPPAARPS
jgi:endonuclease-8